MSAAAQAVPVHGFATLESGDLDRLLIAHKAFLNNAKNGKRAILLSHNLARTDLSNCLFAKADFSGSNMTGSCLKFSNFSNAILYCCDMNNVDARYANFSQADMRGVKLSGSNLSHARLDKADFRGGRYLGIDLNGVELIIDRNGSAVGVDFSYCSISGASFEGADLRNADFSGAMIVSTKFRNARMSGVNLRGAVLTDVDLGEMQLPPDAFKDCVLPPPPLSQASRQHILFQLAAHQNWVESDTRRGTSAVLDALDLRPLSTTIGKYKLTAVSARGVVAAGVDFSCTELQGANFEGADLRGASFEGADIRGIRLKGALLHHAKFLGADMRPLVLKSGDTLPCDLTGTAFSAEQRASAVVV